METYLAIVQLLQGEKHHTQSIPQLHANAMFCGTTSSLTLHDLHGRWGQDKPVMYQTLSP
jgi:hypothetical protein